MLLQKIKYCLIVAPLFFHLGLSAQVEIDKSIQLTGSDTVNKQVRGVNDELEATHLVSAANFQNGSILVGETSLFSNDSILVTTHTNLTAYVPGMLVNFSVPIDNKDSVYINVNGLGWLRLRYKDYVFTPGLLKTGQMLQVLFDGTTVQVVNSLSKTCPKGFKEVTSQFCIEISENPAKTFFNAAIDCGNKNARMCTWNEWYYACQKSTLGLVNMTNNYEWIDSAVNGNHNVSIMGNGGCTVRAQGTDSNTMAYRCCYSK